MASSSCGNTEARAKSPAPARGGRRMVKTKKMKVVTPRPNMKLLLTSRQKWEPLRSLDEEFLRNITALMGTGEQHDATESGFSLDKYLRLDNMADVLNAENDLLAELGEQYQDKGFC